MEWRAWRFQGVCYWALIALVSAATGLSAEDLVLRTKVLPEGRIWVGQKVILQVDVLAKDGWAQVRKVRDLEVPGAIVLRVQTQGTRLTETIDGVSHTGQRYELLVYPQRPGAIEIPAVPVDVEVKSWGAGGGSRTSRMQTPALRFEAQAPPGQETRVGLVSTTRLTMEQVWNPAPGEFKVGGAITRTVVREADGVAGMVFAPFTWQAISGVAAYPSEPEVTDTVDRGVLISGKRVETVTYVLLEAGAVEIPAIELSWWDIESKTMQEASASSLVLEVLPGVATADGDQPASAAVRRSVGRWLTALVGFMILGAALVRCRGAALVARYRDARQRWNEREGAYFKRVLQAARADDAAAILRALMSWLDRRVSTDGTGTIGDFLESADDPELAEQVRRLERMVCGADDDTGTSWAGGVFCRRLKSGRKRARRKEAACERQPELPALNP